MKKLCMLLTTILIVSCSNDEKVVESAKKASQPSNLEGLYCYISGSTVFYDQVTNVGSCVAKPGSSASFYYKSSLDAPDIKWTIIAEPAGSIVVNGSENESSISLTFNSDFEKGEIRSVGEGEKGTCGPVLPVTSK